MKIVPHARIAPKQRFEHRPQLERRITRRGLEPGVERAGEPTQHRWDVGAQRTGTARLVTRLRLERGVDEERPSTSLNCPPARAGVLCGSHTRAGRWRQRAGRRESAAGISSVTPPSCPASHTIVTVPGTPAARRRPGGSQRPRRRRQRATAGAAHKHFRRGCGGGVADDRQHRAGAGVAPRKPAHRAYGAKPLSATRRPRASARGGDASQRGSARRRRRRRRCRHGTRLAEHHEPRHRGARGDVSARAPPIAARRRRRHPRRAPAPHGGRARWRTSRWSRRVTTNDCTPLKPSSPSCPCAALHSNHSRDSLCQCDR